MSQEFLPYGLRKKEILEKSRIKNCRAEARWRSPEKM